MTATLDLVRKAFGPEIAYQLGEEGRSPNVTFLPTGIATLDEALGGGVPAGRIIEIYGPESSGKTATACAIVGSLQRHGYDAVYVDLEYSLNLQEADSNGMSIDDVIISQPDDARTAMKVIETVVRGAQNKTVVVLDSVAGLVTPAELEADPGDARIGETARLMSQMMRKLAGPTSTGEHVLIFTNQLRMKIGVMFGNPETTTGGRALRFWASQRIQLLGRQKLMEGKTTPIGINCRARIDKNKVAPPFKNADYVILFDGTGIDRVPATLTVANKYGIVRKSGGYHYYPPDAEKYTASSFDNMVAWLKDKEHVEDYQEIYNQVVEAVKPPTIETPSA